MNRGTRRERRRYNRVSSETEDAYNSEEEEEPRSTEESEDARSEITDKDAESDEDDFLNEKDCFSVTILDFAQSKFQVAALPTWTILKFKQEGAKVHKVAPARQRLIYRGKMLGEDQKTLEEYGVAEDGVIVHLFPKPRLVITNSDTCDDGTVTTENEEDGGARVPTIVIDASEAGRRAEILVLGSNEFMEAQNNVKLFSFMLLIISSIELLNLFAIAMGVPTSGPAGENGGIPVQEDDYNLQPQNEVYNPGSNFTSGGDSYDPAAELYSHFGTAQYVDAAVSMLGVYVAVLGLQASTENTLRLARKYLLGIIVVGVAWLLFNFFFTAAIERKIEEHQEEIHVDDEDFTPLSEGDMYNQAFQVMVLPSLVWIMCWMRAWHFQQLIYEAEMEAEERIQSQLDMEEEAHSAPAQAADEELALGRHQTAVFT